MQIEGLGTYCLYVARWVVLAVPGAWVLQGVRKVLAGKKGRAGEEREGKENIVLAMLISQCLLGMVVYFVDIFR